MLPAGGLPFALTYAQLDTYTVRPSSFRLLGWSVSDHRQIQRLSNGTLTQTVSTPASTTSPEMAEDTRPSRPCVPLLCSRLALLLSLMFLTGLSAYGPVALTTHRTLMPCASVGRPPLSAQGPSPRNDPFTPAASPVPLASSLVPAGQDAAHSAGAGGSY